MIRGGHEFRHESTDTRARGTKARVLDMLVPDQVRTLSQVGTKKIWKGGWAILELFEPYRNHYLSFRSQSDQERVFTRGQN